METKRIGILHPGEMGISLAATAQRTGHEVWWASAGRGEATRARAARFGLHDARTVPALCARCEVIVSICPPHAAADVACEVAASDFGGLFLDANAISPQRTEEIAEAITAAGGEFVDGGIIGGPAWEPGRTWLYLSGPRAADAAACFSTGPLETQVLDATIGAASALKMCYAAFTKGSTALMCALMATAETLGIRPFLEMQWAREDPEAPERAARRVRAVTAKAWRYVGEMEEIAETFRSAGLPGGFHRAAADTYRRLATFKDCPDPPALGDVLAALRRAPDRMTDSGEQIDGA
jgi:3-hydroxyisobutyrate dehydrogenase-like beta-hydroxyacid dehydrogenase